MVALIKINQLIHAKSIGKFTFRIENHKEEKTSFLIDLRIYFIEDHDYIDIMT
jgi:hypothetical protein